MLLGSAPAAAQSGFRVLARDRFDGAIKLSFFPRIGVELGSLSLSETIDAEVFAAVNSARVSVDVLPLPSGKIMVNRIAIDGLRANLHHHRDGSGNFDDLLESSASGTKQEMAAPTHGDDKVKPEDQARELLKGLFRR